MEERGFDDDEPDEPRPAAESMSLKLLMLALGALSQRFVIALSSLFTVATAGAALFLWWLVVVDPSILKIVGAALASCFVLALEYVRERASG